MNQRKSGAAEKRARVEGEAAFPIPPAVPAGLASALERSGTAAWGAEHAEAGSESLVETGSYRKPSSCDDSATSSMSIGIEVTVDLQTKKIDVGRKFEPFNFQRESYV